MTTSLHDLPCYLNGEYTRLQDAKISVMDRGFIFGDGIYEVAPVYGGVLFRFESHMTRLERGLKELRIPNPHTREQWLAIAQNLITDYQRQCAAANPAAAPPDQLVYIHITRGVAMRDHVMPAGLTPTVFMMTNVMKPPSPAERAHGVACVSAHDFRWEKAHIKAISLLGAVFSRQISADVGATETIMFRGEHLSEAAACNVWIVKDGGVLGVVKDNLVLEGIRFGLIEEICRAQGLRYELRAITRAEVLGADEILLSSATKEVLAVTSLDGKPVGRGQPGPVYAALLAGYQDHKAKALGAVA